MAVTISGDGTLTGVDSVASGLGKILQVEQSVATTSRSTTSTSFVSASLSVSMTPSSSSSKILIVTAGVLYAANTTQGVMTIYRDGTNLGDATWGMSRAIGNGGDQLVSAAVHYLDSPATTSAVTYSVYIRNHNGGTTQIALNNIPTSLTAMEVAA